MAKLAPRGTVHAFEPVPSNFHLLSTNVMLNQSTNVHRDALAISDSPGSAGFTIAADGAYSSFIDTKRKLVQSKFIVEMTSLDAYCEANAIARIDCLKVDVEGAEGKVIAGASRLLSDPSRRPRLIIMELYNPMLTMYGTSIQAIVSILAGYGYQPKVEREAGTLSPLTPEEFDVHYNVFFLPS